MARHQPKFRFRLKPALLTGLMLIILIGLGTWQIERLHWKENLIAHIDERSHLPPVDIAELSLDQDQDYRPAVAHGILQNDRAMYLTAISLEGAGGFHLLTPLMLEDGHILLVDRGWIPYEAKPKGDEAPRFSHPEGRVAITGILRKPLRSIIQSTNHPEANDWFHIDLPAMAVFAHDSTFLPYILEADDTPNVHGLPEGGQTRRTLLNNHLEYALTWYSLALILLIIYLVSSRRPRAED